MTFEVEHALCRACKQDLPEVQAVIELLRRPVEREWRRLVGRIIDEVEERLEELTDGRGESDVDALEEDSEAAILLTLLAFITDQIQGAQLAAARLRPATRQLLLDGAASVRLPLDLERHAALRAAAEADALTLLRGRTLSREDQLRGLLEAFLTTRSARTSEPPAAAAVSLRGRRPLSTPPRSRQEFNVDLRAVLDAESASVANALDQWAYRWFAVAQLQAGLDAGFRIFRYVNNPPQGPDERTTPFCRWVHNRTLPLRAAEGQLRAHIRAVAGGDIEALMSNWPLLSSAVARGNDERVWRRHLAQNPLPGFHHLCRTTIRPLRTSEL